MKKYFLPVLVIFLVFSCSREKYKEDDNLSVNNSAAAYLPMNVGNYWIYQAYTCNRQDKNCRPSYIDSVYITKDTTINRNTYYVFEGTRFGAPYKAVLRDSSNFIVNEKGQIRFALDQWNEPLYTHVQVSGDQLNDTLYTVEYHMEKPGKKVKTGVGTYNALLFKGMVYLKNNDTPYSKSMGNFYVRNIGLIKEESFYFGSGDLIHRDLIRYKID